MTSHRRAIDDSGPAADGRTVVGLSVPGRRRSCGAKRWRLVWAVAFCLAFTGCSLLGGPSWWPTSQDPAPTKSWNRREDANPKKGLFGSWFGREEARPSETMSDFLSMPRLDP